jgi:hypothetical protein
MMRIAIAVGAIVVAIGLAGCAGPPAPFSVEEKLYFNKAIGYDLIRPLPSLPPQPGVGPPPWRAPLSSRN